MKFATLAHTATDGRLVLVSLDLHHAVDVAHIARSLIDALERWDDVTPALQARYDAQPAFIVENSPFRAF
ncbi:MULTISPECIES: hypothetical protein [unclassified Ralstonia]|uniref:hypothetical protein n=1 Tax=unclassified Ralstonia TaxID=209769 RepID=UPI0011BEC98B|nr:hypothetical protein [Ralstonia sp. TCR112]TXD60011.1 hypothetical protein FUT88_11585 [Ralstonia sp. TCR112]